MPQTTLNNGSVLELLPDGTMTHTDAQGNVTTIAQGHQDYDAMYEAIRSGRKA